MQAGFLDENVPEEFPFPFKPYDIQLDFMKSIYRVFQSGKLGIFESPTGTGKSLSIICGALKWLKDYNEWQKQALYSKIAELEQEKAILHSEEKEWFSAQSKEIEVTRKLNELKIEERRLIEYDKKIENIRTNAEQIEVRKYKTCQQSAENNLALDTKEEQEDADILLEEATTDDKLSDDEVEESQEKYHPIQIIIASRTHSQLTQFVGEIKKSPYGEDIRVVSLASRQNYCINPAVRKLSNMTLINEKCLDMQKSSQKKGSKKQKNSSCQCPYFKQSNIETLRNFALNQVNDIEDLVEAGKQVNACPYYTARKAAEDAEVILVPYNTILHKSTREASGVSLKNNIVIIDEAHNILEALAQMHSSELTYAQLFYSLSSLKCYKQRYNTMFSAKNLRFINQLIFVVEKLLNILDNDVKEDTTQIYTLENFVTSAGIEQYNFFQLTKFCKFSKLAQKVRSYFLKYPLAEELVAKNKKPGLKSFLSSISKAPQPQEKPPELKIPPPSNSLLGVIGFLDSLTHSYEDGRILVTKNEGKIQSKLQFLLLNPTENFRDVLQEARSVVVAGGTMKPMAEFRDRLFVGSGAERSRISQFSCDHIIPQENILPIAVTTGMKGEKLLFNYTNRVYMGKTLVDIIQKTCQIVPGGIVVFFPSYNYENWIHDQIKTTTLNRPLFREPQKSGSVDEVLEKYASTIKKSKNAIMFSVVGGKLSEGLNFSDDLGRCVIVVGLPYANIMAADLKEKMTFLDKKEGQGSGQVFYENLCMKSVNQCIGRAVRHRNDYATVLLLDERYAHGGVKKNLPDWINRGLKVASSGECFQMIEKFFRERKPVGLK